MDAQLGEREPAVKREMVLQRTVPVADKDNGASTMHKLRCCRSRLLPGLIEAQRHAIQPLATFIGQHKGPVLRWWRRATNAEVIRQAEHCELPCIRQGEVPIVGVWDL